MLIQLKSQGRDSRSVVSSRSIGSLAMVLVCGSLVAACSGTIDTPTEEFPSRQERNASAADDDDDAPAAARPTAPAPARPVAAADEDDDDAPVTPVDDEAEPIEAEEPEDEEPAAEPAGDVSFASDVQPIFNTSCGPCHVSAGLGGQNIGSDDLAEALDDSVAFEDAVLRDIGAGRMPPGCGSPPGGGGNCVTEEDFEAIEAWYAAGAPE